MHIYSQTHNLYPLKERWQWQNVCSEQSGIRSCRFALDSPVANHSRACFIEQHIFTHSIPSKEQAPRSTRAIQPPQAEEEHSTLHKSTGSQQTSQGRIKNTGSKCFSRKLELHVALKKRREAFYAGGTAERFVWEGEAGWGGLVGHGQNTRSLTGCRFGTS